MNQFSVMLNKLLKDKSVTKVAKEIGMPKSLLSEWRSSKKGPNLSSMHHVRKLASYLGVSFEELLFGEEGFKEKEEVLTIVNFKDGQNTFSVKITKMNLK